MRKLDPSMVPQTIINRNKREEADRDIRKTVASVQTAVRSLAEDSDVVIPASSIVKEWKAAAKAADVRLEKAKERILQDYGLAESEKQQKIAAWQGWHKRVSTQITHVVICLEKYPQAAWKYDEYLQNIVPTASLSAIADEAATVQVPKEAEEHALLLSLVYDAVNGLRQWEKEHGIDKKRLEELFCYDEKRLAELWATGAFTIDTNFDTPQIVAARELRYKNIV